MSNALLPMRNLNILLHIKHFIDSCVKYNTQTFKLLQKENFMCCTFLRHPSCGFNLKGFTLGTPYT